MAQLPLYGASCGIPQGRKGGFDKPTLAVKIIDLARIAEGIPILFSYDVFPDGRRVLQVMDFLTLDDDWKRSTFGNKGDFVPKMQEIFEIVPEFMPFIVALIRAFDCKGNRRTEDAKAAAVKELGTLYN